MPTNDMSAPPPGGAPSLGRLVPRRSTGLKLILVCALALAMAIPALFVYGVVNERTMGAERALGEVSAKAGGRQSVLGPFLAVPFSRAPNPEKPEHIVYGLAVAFASSGVVETIVNVEERERGIYRVPVYAADIAMAGKIDPEALREAVPDDATPLWNDARLYLGVSDPRGLRGEMVVRDSETRLSVEPVSHSYSQSGDYQPVPWTGLDTLAAARIESLATRDAPLDLSVQFTLGGAERLAFAPFARETVVEMTSNWDSPSFTGAVLPVSHDVGEAGMEGFSARWDVPYLARGIAGAGTHLDLTQLTSWDQKDMAVRFVQPANPYQSVERSLKYGAMFIGFVFLSWFLFEVTEQARAHPAQYILLGLAQTIFYLLLLAFAERMGFDLAFVIASTMTVGLIALYSANVFRSTMAGLKALGVLTGIYALIYVLMRAADHALLAGALASFIAIALTMFMTRNVDWYGERAS